MNQPVQRSHPARRWGRWQIVICLLLPLCAGCTSAPDLLRPPKPRTIAWVPADSESSVPGVAGGEIMCPAGRGAQS